MSDENIRYSLLKEPRSRRKDDTKVNLNKLLHRFCTRPHLDFNHAVLRYQRKHRVTSANTPYAIILHNMLDIYNAYRCISKLALVHPELLHVPDKGQTILHKICAKTVYNYTKITSHEYNVLDICESDDSTSSNASSDVASSWVEDGDISGGNDSERSPGAQTYSSANTYYFNCDMHGTLNVYQTYLCAHVLHCADLFNVHVFVNAQDSKNLTALQYATENGNLALMCHLLQHNADPLMLRYSTSLEKSDPTFIGHQIYLAFNKLYHNSCGNVTQNGTVAFTAELFSRLVLCFTRVFPFMYNLDSVHMIHFEPFSTVLWVLNWRLKDLYILYVRCIIKRCMNFSRAPSITQKTFDKMMPYLRDCDSMNTSFVCVVLDEIFKVYPKKETQLLFNGMTILHLACFKNNSLLFNKCLNTFARQDFNLNVRDKYNKIPLQYAIKYGNIHFSATMILRGADINNLQYENIPLKMCKIMIMRLAISIVIQNHKWPLQILVPLLKAIQLYHQDAHDYMQLMPEFPLVFEETLSTARNSMFAINTLDWATLCACDTAILERCYEFYAILYKYNLMNFNLRLINFIFFTGNSMVRVLMPQDVPYYGDFDVLEFSRRHIRALLSFVTNDAYVARFLTELLGIHEAQRDAHGKSFVQLANQFIEIQPLTVTLANYALEHVGVNTRDMDRGTFDVSSLQHLARNTLRKYVFRGAKKTSPLLLLEDLHLPRRMKNYIAFCQVAL